jgi:hypothetical protein
VVEKIEKLGQFGEKCGGNSERSFGLIQHRQILNIGSAENSFRTEPLDLRIVTMCKTLSSVMSRLLPRRPSDASPPSSSSEATPTGAWNWRQYMNGHAGVWGISNPEWQVFTNQNGYALRSMLSLGEASVCYSLARDCWTGIGEIVDLGPLLGLSTYSFCKGVEHNPRVAANEKAKRIWSYDLFLTENMPVEFDRTRQSKQTGSLFGEFLEFNRDQLNAININPGDMLQLRWGDAPVEIVFVDAAKTLALNDWVLRYIFTQLLPGAHVIQQDLIYDDQWWICGAMEYFHEFFDIIDYCWGATGIFQLKSLSPAECGRFHELCRKGLSHLTWREWQALMERAEQRHGEVAREMLRLARVRMLLAHGQVELADALLNTVTGRQVTTDVYHDFSNLVRPTISRVRERIRAAKTA